MNDSGDSTRRPRAIDPVRFRAQATGVGQTQQRSLATGTWRGQRVAADLALDPDQRRAVPRSEGFQTPIDPGTGMPFPDFCASDMDASPRTNGMHKAEQALKSRR